MMSSLGRMKTWPLAPSMISGSSGSISDRAREQRVISGISSPRATIATWLVADPSSRIRPRRRPPP
jgi:hypothetical protein